jgi:nitrite reductase (NADH) small subunit
MIQWIEIGHLQDIPRLGARVVTTDRGNIALFRTASDEVLALDDRCPHRGGPLSQGIVHGKVVTCPLHNRQINLTDGQVLAPDKGCTHSYPVKVIETGQLLLGIPEMDEQPLRLP